MRNLSNDPPPGVGPYMITRRRRRTAASRCQRNPRLRELRRSPTSRPATSTRSDVKIVSNTQSEAQQVLNNEADVFDAGDTLPPSLLPQIESQASDRFSREPIPSTFYFFLNTHEAAVQQRAGAPGGQLRDRPRGDGAARERLPEADVLVPPGGHRRPSGRAPARTATSTSAGHRRRRSSSCSSRAWPGTPITVWGQERSPRTRVRRLLHRPAEQDRLQGDDEDHRRRGLLPDDRQREDRSADRLRRLDPGLPEPVRLLPADGRRGRSSRRTTRTSARSNDPKIQSRAETAQPGAGDRAGQRRRRVGGARRVHGEKSLRRASTARSRCRSSSPTGSTSTRPSSTRRTSTTGRVAAAEVGVDAWRPSTATVRAGTRRRAGPRRGRAGRASARTGSALRRLRRNKAALAFGALFLLIVVLCLCAPLYAEHVAHTTPNANHVTDTVTVGGVRKDVVSPTGQPIGPTWQGRFLLGADQNGRDIAVRLLYGGRNSLEVGFVATLHHDGAGDDRRHRRRLLPRRRRRRARARARPDLGLSRSCCWGSRSAPRSRSAASPSGRCTCRATRCCVPAFIIGDRLHPVRRQADPRAGAAAARAGVRRRRARRQGAGPLRIMWSEILPNLVLDAHRVRPADDRQRDPAGGGAVLPRRRRAAAEPVVGDDDLRRHPPDPERDAPDVRAGRDARARRAGGQRLRRRRARRARPAREGADRGHAEEASR